MPGELRIDRGGHASLPPGRFVSGTTDTPAGPVTVFGVCIPWRDAHVSTGTRDRKVWEDHLSYLAGLHEFLSTTQGPFIVLGDFNQTVPRRWQPEYVFEALVKALGDSCQLATSGEIDGISRLLIDHLAHSPELTVSQIQGINRVDSDGTRLSDHHGVVLRAKQLFFCNLAESDLRSNSPVV